MAYTDRSIKISKIVLNGTPEVQTKTPGNGEVWDIYEIGASLPPDKNVKCEIIWDYGNTNEKKWSCHGNWPTERRNDLQVVGDGTKQLAVKITNDSGSAETCLADIKIGEQG